MAFANDCLEMSNQCLNDILVVQTEQATEGNVDFQIRDKRAGNPVNLNDLLDGSSSSSSSSSNSSTFPSSSSSSSSSTPDPVKHGVELLLKEAPESSQYYLQKMLEEVDYSQGKVRLVAEDDDLEQAGLYIGVAVVWKNGIRIRNYPLYFEIEPSLEDIHKYQGLSIAEVRLALRDSCPDINFLLDEKEYAAKEIAWAIRRAVDYWNEVPPPVETYNTSNFPYHYHWMESVIGELQVMVGTWKLRNHLDYNAGGVSIDDTRRWRDYMEQGLLRQKTYKDWVLQKKLELNINGSIMLLRSNYASGWWSSQ